VWGRYAVKYVNIVLAAGGEEAEPTASGVGLGIGAVALILVVVLLLVWMTYLVLNSRRSRAAAQEALPPNQSPGISDDELENRKLTRVLRAALLGSILMAVIMPWYAFNEPGRQEAFAESTIEANAEEGAHWYSAEGFACQNCHGPEGVGGAAEFVEPRSGVDTSWAVPSLNDVFYRYSEEEVRHWIVYGREGTPMPANGLEGGGAMTVQEIDQVIEYLVSIEITQEEAFAKSDGTAAIALTQLEGGDETTQKLINFQKIQIEEVKNAPETIAVVGGFPDDVKDLFAGAGTCTEATAEVVDSTCTQPGADTDRDGLSDETEKGLTEIAAVSFEELSVINAVVDDITYGFVTRPEYDVWFDSFDAFTNDDVPDLDEAQLLLAQLEGDVLLLGVVDERQDQFLEGLESGLEFLEESLEGGLWEIDFETVAVDMGVPVEDAELAVGLFNGYCARCHTAGYSAGATFDQGSGTGAWGPSLVDGRSEVQFPEMLDQVKLVIEGSDNGEGYGVNGLGSGRMPSFGQILSERQIELIVMYERTL
jgi:mono/diheme cytochrome c family protein